MQVRAYVPVFPPQSEGVPYRSQSVTEGEIWNILDKILAADISNLESLRETIDSSIDSIEEKLEEKRDLLGEDRLNKIRANVIQYLQEVVDEYNRLAGQQSPEGELVGSAKFGLPPNLNYYNFVARGGEGPSFTGFRDYICQVCGRNLGKHSSWNCVDLPLEKSRKIVKLLREYQRVTDYTKDRANLTKLEDMIEDRYKMIVNLLFQRGSDADIDYIDGLIKFIEESLNEEKAKLDSEAAKISADRIYSEIAPQLSTLSLIRSNIISYLGYVVEDIQGRREAKAPTPLQSIFDLPRIQVTTDYRFLTNTEEEWWTAERLAENAEWLRNKVVGPPGKFKGYSREQYPEMFGIWVKKSINKIVEKETKPKKLTEDEFIEQLKPFNPEEKLIEIADKKFPLKLFEDYVNAVRAMRAAGFGGLLYGGQYFVPPLEDPRQLEIFEKYDRARNEAHIAIKDYLGIKTFELPKIGTTGEIDQSASETIEHDNFMKELDKAVLEQLEEPKEATEKNSAEQIFDKLYYITKEEEAKKPTLDLNKYGIEKWGEIGNFQIWIVDGCKIKKEIDANWACGPEETNVYIAGHPKVQLFTFLVPENTIIVSTERKTEKEIIASISHEFVEYHMMKNGMKYEDADPIARDVENLIVKLYENNFVNKANWMTNMVDLASPTHFETTTRRFPIHKEEEEKSVEQGLARVQQFIDKLIGTSEPAVEGESYEERSAHRWPFTALQSNSLG